MDGPETVVSNWPTIELLVSTISSIDWQVFSFVTLVVDDDNWLDGSGCMNPTDGLSVMLSVDRIQYVSSSAPNHPADLVPFFESYLNQRMDVLFGQIYDAATNNLSAVQVENIRLQDELPQRQRMLDETINSSAKLFAEKRYAEYVDVLTPYESVLPPIHQKKWQLAKKRITDNAG